jgi:hypothetical protein
MNNSTTRRTPMPAEATWDDYVAAHGGAEATGWWVTLCWYADSEHPRPEVVGPYTSYEQAVSAMQDSLLIDSFAEDTKRDEWLDDVYVATDPSSITRTCAEYGHRVTLIDPGDPHHFGEPDPSTREPGAAGSAGQRNLAGRRPLPRLPRRMNRHLARQVRTTDPLFSPTPHPRTGSL